MLTRAEAEAFRTKAFMLACQVGLKPAADALGIKPERMRKWNERYKWRINGRALQSSTDSDLADSSRSVTTPIQAMANIMSKMADRTRLAMARTAMRAFEHSEKLKDEELHEMERAIALEKHGRIASVSHNWQSERNTVAVQVNVPLPSAEEQAELRAMDRKLDAIAERLR